VLNELMAAAERARAAAQSQLDAAEVLPSAYLRQAFPRPGQKLPSGWRWLKLGEVSSIHPGQHIMEADYSYNHIGIGYLTGPADFGLSTAIVSKWTEKPKAFAQPGDVLITVKGAGVGKANLAPAEKVAIGRQLMAVRAARGLSDSDFLYLFASTQLSTLSGRALGATVPGLGREDVESLMLALPPLVEQKRFAAILKEQIAAAEKLRVSLEAQLTEISTLPAALLRGAFAGEL
jgi:type I restriction enzyme S subunit